ncbi:carboxypeptidase-like regulatory domain-containing protein [Ignavibacteria bacterium 4148-Me]|uniref:TonB-dependent receptor n=1 Tax=Rosettibacter primus TaxID=3111523 RepID=UPI00336BE75B
MNNIKKVLFIFYCVVIVNSINAQSTGILRGLVTDSTNSEPLAFGNVFIKELGIGTSTDSRGYFIIPSIPAEKNFTLIISYVGFQTKSIVINLAKNKITHYNIKLVPASVELKTIEKVAERINKENQLDLSLQRLLSRDIESLPQGVESDLFRSLQYLPGVQSTGDISARFYVRGGASNQNLVLIDGITLYNPFHALGIFSVIDPDIINNVEFFKGGFSSEFGNRLSSIMKIITKDGNKNNFSAKASASYLSGKFMIEGPIPDGSFYFAGRKSYSTFILKKFLNDKNVPADFYDFSFKTNYSNSDFVPGAKFSFNGFFSGDRVTNQNPLLEDFKWSNNLFGFKWFQISDSPLFFELGVYFSNFKGEVIPKFSNVYQSENKIEDATLQMDFSYVFDSKDELGVGFHVKQIKTNLITENLGGTKNNFNSSGANIVFYSKYKLLRWNFIGIDAGTRINLSSLSGNDNLKTFEPRFSFTLKPFSFIALKGSIGLYQQELITITDENEVINLYEPLTILPSYLIPPAAIHYIGGIDISFTNNLNLTAEGYFKKIKNLPLLNDKKVLFNDPDFISGNGESSGLEFLLKYKNDYFQFTSSYTFAYAYKEIDGEWYYPRYDVRHSASFIFEFNPGKDWLISLTWLYNSGLPFTQILGYYDKLYLDNLFIPWYQLDARQPYTIIGIQNLGRLPDYHRMDLSLSKKFRINFVSAILDINLINVYNRKNIFYFKRETGERVNMLPFLPTASIKIEL